MDNNLQSDPPRKLAASSEYNRGPMLSHHTPHSSTCTAVGLSVFPKTFFYLPGDAVLSPSWRLLSAPIARGLVLEAAAPAGGGEGIAPSGLAADVHGSGGTLMLMMAATTTIIRGVPREEDQRTRARRPKAPFPSTERHDSPFSGNPLQHACT